MLKFTLFKIPVSIQWWFFLVAAFLGGGLHANTPEAMQRMVVAMAAIFVSILVHELGHALTGLKLGAPRAEIALHGMGGHAAFPGANLSRRSRMLMTAAGPAASIVLGALFVGVREFGFEDNADYYLWQTTSGHFVRWMVYVNVVWTIFNLFPVLPLDGGQLARDALGPAKFKLACVISFVSLPFLGLLVVTYTRSYFNLILIAVLANYNWQVYKAVTQRQI